MPLPPGALLELTPQGLYCRAAGAWIDPWRPVPRALISHAHADHARPGCGEYWAIGASEAILRQRLGATINLIPVDYGALHRIGEARVSFHSAGHVLGSAQIRLEAGGESWLVSGDYKRCADPSCAPFEPVAADVFITEATFGLPIYRWQSGAAVARQILEWWQAAPERPSILFAYAFGKAQRLLAELRAIGVGEAGQPGGEGNEILLHGAVETLMPAYREAGVKLPPTRPASAVPRSEPLAGRLVIAPPSAHRSLWMKRFKLPQTAFVSGWMAVRGARRRRGYERGFVMSDHADWPGLLQSARDSGARQVYVTHGNSDGLARYLREVEGISAEPLEGGFTAERGDELEEAQTGGHDADVGAEP
ncbi:MAG: ligase-associated DNA damage response exonuclease [Prochlorococcaceae cyanobacterium]